MKKFGFLIVLLSFLLACQKDYNKIKHAYQFLPNNTSTVCVINERNDFLSSIENHDILSSLHYTPLKRTSEVLKHLNTTNQILIGFSPNTDATSDYLILTQNDSTLFVLDSLPNTMSETLMKLNIKKTQIDSTVIYHKVFGNIFAGSNNLELLKTLGTKNENTELSKLIESTNKASVASVVFKTDSKDYSKLLFVDVADKGKNYSVLDFSYSENSLNYNGVLISQDSITNHLDVFKHTIPQKTSTTELAPFNTPSLLSISYDDFSVLSKNLRQLQDQDIDSTQTFLNFTNEIAAIENALLIHALDPKLVLESIENKSNFETFRGIEIYAFNDSDFFKTRLRPLITFEDAQYISFYENFVIVSNSSETIKTILSEALNNNTLANSDAFKNISKNLSDEASLFVFKNSDGLSDILDQNLKGYQANAVQYIYENNYAHINGIIQKFKRRAASNTISEAFATTVDSDIIVAPQTLRNHVTDAFDIAVQDVNNTLYLISSSGTILWKKQLQGKILGKIEQIDMYKNGRLQLAFATPKRVYVLDRNGNDVAPFPLKFNDAITQPLSVFDYDKRKSYRLLVTQNKSLLMYDGRGKSVNGFDYTNNGSGIKTQPKHFRIGTRDFIVFAAGETLKILNRQGDVRISVKNKISFSENELYLYQNKFTTTNTLGQLVQVDSKGTLSTTNLNLTDKHRIETTSKTLVSMTENKLNIKSRTVDLDYGEYTAPRIFYLNDKIYITTTDLQAKKVYLFDSEAKLLPNFPVFGTSAAELQKLDNDAGLELITQSDSSNIIVYKIH